MPYSYTNRHGKTHYFRAVETKTGREVDLIEDVAREYGQHLGRDSFFDIPPKGYE